VGVHIDELPVYLIKFFVEVIGEDLEQLLHVGGGGGRSHGSVWSPRY
jgi:hypothetical protein